MTTNQGKMNSIAVQRELAKFKENFLKIVVKKNNHSDKTPSSLNVSRLKLREIPNEIEDFASKIKEIATFSSRLPSARRIVIEKK